MPEELITDYETKLSTSDCHPGAEWFRVFVTLHDDISEVLPYLNAELDQPTDYRHSEGFLLWKHGNKNYAFRPTEIIIAPVADNEEALELTKSIIGTINDIWKRKDAITPDVEGSKPLPNALDLFKLLPRTNCRECGFPTCMAFAVELRTDFTKSSLCPDLSEDDFQGLVGS